MEESFAEHGVAFGWISDLRTRMPLLPMLVIARRAESVYAERALRAGASVCFVNTGDAGGLLSAVGAALANSKRDGVDTISPRLATHRSASRQPMLEKLSNRELEVFSLIAAGYGITHIATQLGISRKTVETHCEHIKIKLNYQNAQELKRGARGLR
jgi:DNA-binding NarL/FixJ family response regulator